MFDDVHPGDPIPKLAAFWNNLKTAVAARRLLPGVGVRLSIGRRRSRSHMNVALLMRTILMK